MVGSDSDAHAPTPRDALHAVPLPGEHLALMQTELLQTEFG